MTVELVPDGKVQMLIGFQVTVDIPVSDPDRDLVRKVRLDTVSGSKHVSGVNQRSATRVLGDGVDGDEEPHVPRVLPVLGVAVQISSVTSS